MLTTVVVYTVSHEARDSFVPIPYYIGLNHINRWKDGMNQAVGESGPEIFTLVPSDWINKMHFRRPSLILIVIVWWLKAEGDIATK